MRGSKARNNLFGVANAWTRRELAPNIDVSPTLVWSPNDQRLAFVSGDTDIYTVNADGSRLTKHFAGDACKAANFEIAWFFNSPKLLFASSCDGFTSNTPGSQSLYTSETSGIKGTKLVRNLEVGGEPHKTEFLSEFYLSPDGQQVAFIKDRNIYKMKADGSGMTKLTKSIGNIYPAEVNLLGRQIAQKLLSCSALIPNSKFTQLMPMEATSKI
jgi:Tol biopolymer transport system component